MNEQGFLYDSFIKKIRARWMFQNKNWLAVVCGETGSGKSYSALALAHEVGENVYTVFSPIEFLELLRPGILNKGDVIIFDEAGVGMSSRDWYSVQNKLLGSILQTFRHLNLCVIFTVPNLSFIDVQARKLFHHYFETANLDYKLKLASLRVREIQVNSQFDKIYYKKPRFQTSDGVVVAMSHIVMNKIPVSISEPYEKQKSEFSAKLREDSLNELRNPKGKKAQPIDEDAIKQKVMNSIKTFTNEYNGRRFIDHHKIASDYNIPVNTALRIKKALNTQKKGGI